MKKLAVGCLLLAVLAGVLLAAGAYVAWDYLRPVVRTVTDVTAGVTRLGGLAEIEAGLTTTSPFTAPVSGKFTGAQLERFMRVQRHVRAAIGTEGEAFAAKYRQLSDTLPDGTVKVPSLPELLGGIGDLQAVYVDAWRAQVRAMNAEGFSRAEFAWVRSRVYQAAGVDAVRYDAAELAQVVTALSRGVRAEAPEVTLPDVPAPNRKLVQPHAAEMKGWLAMALFGL